MKNIKMDRRKKLKLLIAGTFLIVISLFFKGYRKTAVVNRVEAMMATVSFSYVGLDSLPLGSRKFIDSFMFGIWPREVTWISLQSKPLKDEFVSDLSCLKSLRVLKIEKCGIADIAPLAKLTKLRSLSLTGNNITDLSGLAGLSKMRTLNLEDNPNLTLLEINQLQNALPSCKIDHNTSE